MRLRDVLLGNGLRADGGGPSGAVSLLGARIGGLLDLLGGTVCSRSNPRLQWEIDGLTYTRIPRLALKRTGRPGWSCWAGGTPTYAAQPYQQLAAAYRAEGHDSDVRAILIAQSAATRSPAAGLERRASAPTRCRD